jgi:hypothetical protein
MKRNKVKNYCLKLVSAQTEKQREMIKDKQRRKREKKMKG